MTWKCCRFGKNVFSDIIQCVVRVRARNACGWVEWVNGICDWVKENEVCQWKCLSMSFIIFHWRTHCFRILDRGRRTKGDEYYFEPEHDFQHGVGDLLWAGATWGRWMEPLHQLHMPRPLTIYWLNLSWSFHGIQSGKKPRLERACACWTGFGSHKAVNIPKSWGHDVMNCDERWVPLQIRAWGFSPARNRWRGVGCMGLWFTDALIGCGESRSLQIQGCASLSHHPSLSCQRGLDLECIFLSLLSGVSVFP